MFVMTADITLGSYRPVKPHAVTWKYSVDDFSDTAVIRLPGVAVMRKEGDQYRQVPTAQQVQVGMPVEVAAGYNGRNVTRFVGFIRRINYTIPVELECEGYAYALRQAKPFSKSYKTTTLKALLQDVISGTAVELHPAIPDVPLSNIWFKEVNRIEVLEYLKKKCLLSVCFVGRQLYAGIQQHVSAGRVKLALGYNTVKDDELKMKEAGTDTEVVIKVPQKSGGTKKHTKKAAKPNATNLKTYTVQHVSGNLVDGIAGRLQTALTYQGYEGKITCFLEPLVQPGMSAVISSAKYPERGGTYFVESVEGEFGPSGGRQAVGIGERLL